MRRADLREWMGATKVSSSARLVFCALYAHLGAKHHHQAFPSLPTLAEATGLARSTVHLAIGELERSGEVVALRRKGRVTTYLLSTVPPEPVRQSDPMSDLNPSDGRTHPSDTPTKPVRWSDPKELKEVKKERAGPDRRTNGGVDNSPRLADFTAVIGTELPR